MPERILSLFLAKPAASAAILFLSAQNVACNKYEQKKLMKENKIRILLFENSSTALIYSRRTSSDSLPSN